MTFWIIAGGMSLLAAVFIVLPLVTTVNQRKIWLSTGIVLVVPVAAVMIYLAIGSPDAATHPELPSPPPMQTGEMPAGHPPNPMMNMDLGQLADKLAEKLKASPDNADGWALLARTYVETKRFKEALPAFEKATSLLPKDPHLLADYADAITMNNGGQFDERAEALISKALAIDPKHIKALMLRATLEFSRKHYAKAIEIWEKILAMPDLDAETRKLASSSIEEARNMAKSGK